MELQVIEQNVIVQAFQTQGGTDALFERIAQEARSFVPDVTTDKGRKAIGSLAAKVSSSKKLAEKYAIDLVADQKAKIKIVDQDRIQFCKKMDALRDEILAPRDAYQKAEDDRNANHESKINEIKGFANTEFLQTATAEMLKGAISCLDDMAIDSSFEEYEQEAKLAKFETLEALRTTLVAREKYEAEQAELEALRLAEQQRIQREHEECIAREATEKAQREAEQKARLEAERVQREKLEAEQREARLKAEKEAAELREQQLKAQAEQAAKQAEIDRKNAVEVERKRIEQEAQAKADAERKAEEQRKANVEHMRSINCEAVKALCFEIPSLTEEMAKDVIRAIAKNSVPNVSIKY